jgi:hypothetical protein
MSELQTYVDSQIAEISPLKKISLEIAERENAIEISDNDTLKTALAIRKEITKHQTTVKNARLDITRQFDDVKSQFIEAEKDVLEPAETAKQSIGHKIMLYEEEQERLRLEEARRIEIIISTFATNVRQLRSMKAVDERGAELKKIFNALPQADQDNVAINLAFTVVINSLLERKDEIRTAEVSEAEKARATAERRGDLAIAQLQAIDTEKAALKAQTTTPKTGVKTVTKFTVIDPSLVPRELCVPSDQLIREAVKNGMTEIPGVVITKEKSF